MSRRVAIAAIVLAIVAACGQAPTPSGPQPVLVEGRDSGFALSMRLDSDVVDAGAPIGVSSILTWEGAAPAASIWGSGGGPVSFSLEQVGGPLNIGGAISADCAKHDYARLVPIAIPFQKSGSYSADDPNAAFYRTYFADPVLRLPAGHWNLTAIANGYLKPCDMNAPQMNITLRAEILVR